MTEPVHLTEKRLKILFVVIPAAVVLLAVIFIVAGRKTPPPVVMPAQQVILTEVESREITESREYVAVMEADEIVDLRARVSGFLISKPFKEGDLVEAGQLLFQIEPDQYQATLDTAEASVLSAQAQFDRASLDFNRISDLYRKNTSTKSDYDRAKADYETSLAALMSANASQTQARLNLQYASIRAPFAGLISDTPYSVGSLLSLESGVLAQVVSVDPILVTFGISDKVITDAQRKDLGKKHSINDWQVRLRLGPDNYYSGIGKFSYIAPIVDPQTDTVKFKAKFDNPDKLLRPGQIVTVVVERTDPEKRLVLPKEAVLTDPDGNYVLMPREAAADPAKPGSQPGLVAEMRRIVLEDGDILDKDYIIKDGLAEGDKVITKGLMAGGATLRANSPISIAPAEKPAEAAVNSPAGTGEAGGQ